MLHHAADDGPRAVADGIDIDLDGIFQELIDQNRVLGAGLDSFGHVTVETVLIVDDFHGAATKDEAGANHHWIADTFGNPPRLFTTGGRSVGRLPQPETFDHQTEPLTVLGQVDALGASADDWHTFRLERLGQIERGLTAELDDYPLGLDPLADVEHVLDRERLEEQAVRGVVVGADGLGVGVDHHHLEAVGLECEGGLAAAVVELDALANPVRTSTQNHDAGAVTYPSLVFTFVSRIIIRSDRLEFSSACIDQLEHGMDPPPLAVAANLTLGGFPQCGQLPVGEPVLLGQPDEFITGLCQRAGLSQPALDLHQFFDVGQEPGVDSCDRVNTINIYPSKERIADIPDALRVGDGEPRLDLVVGRLARGSPEVFLVAAQTEATDFQPAESFLK